MIYFASYNNQCILSGTNYSEFFPNGNTKSIGVSVLISIQKTIGHQARFRVKIDMFDKWEFGDVHLAMFTLLRCAVSLFKSCALQRVQSSLRRLQGKNRWKYRFWDFYIIMRRILCSFLWWGCFERKWTEKLNLRQNIRIHQRRNNPFCLS